MYQDWEPCPVEVSMNCSEYGDEAPGQNAENMFCNFAIISPEGSDKYICVDRNCMSEAAYNAKTPTKIADKVYTIALPEDYPNMICTETQAEVDNLTCEFTMSEGQTFTAKGNGHDKAGVHYLSAERCIVEGEGTCNVGVNMKC
jgi:hypothetical protein